MAEDRARDIRQREAECTAVDNADIRWERAYSRRNYCRQRKTRLGLLLSGFVERRVE